MASLAPHLLAGLRENLLAYRKRLLDLSLRNRLLSWKASKRFTIHLEGFSLAEAYAALMDGEDGNVEIIPVYDEEVYAAVKKRVPNRSGFMTDMAEKALADKCLVTRREGDAVERDSGINHLHLVVGFLEWFDEMFPEKPLRAPLILIPVRLVKIGNNRVTGIAEYAVEYDQTEVILNPCLVEKMKELSIKLPSFLNPDGDAPNANELHIFLNEIEDIARSRNKWRVIHETKITFLSFAKLRMWRDLDPAQWPEEGALENKHLIQSLFGLAAANEGADDAETARSIEDDPKADSLPLVVVADSSQHQAIADACRGTNLVIEGPPGTGKSQSITNILASLIAEGKSVLFVCEKFAALDVVKRNLEGVGLGAFCLELHGTKASKPAVYADIRKRLERTFPFPTRLPSVLSDWKNIRQKLNDYVSAAAKQIGPRNEMYFEIVGKLENLRGRDINPPTTLAGTGKPCTRFSEREQFLTEMQRLLSERGMPREHSWYPLDARKVFPGEEHVITEPLERTVQLLEFILQCEAFVDDALGTRAHLKLENFLGLTPEKLTSFNVPEFVDWSAKHSLSKKANRRIVEEGRREASQIQEIEQKASAALPEALYSKLPGGILEALKSCAARKFSDRPISTIPIDSFRILAEEFDKLREIVEAASQFTSEAVDTLDNVARLRQQLAIFNRLDHTVESDLIEEFFQTAIKAALENAKISYDALMIRRIGLSDIFSMVGPVPPAQDIRTIREDIKVNGASLLKRLLSKNYRKAKQSTYRWLTLPSVYEYPTIVAQLEQLESLSAEEQSFAEDDSYKRLGHLFKGVSTDWKRLQAAVEWAGDAKSTGLSLSQILRMASNAEKVIAIEEKINLVWVTVQELRSEIEASGVIDKNELADADLQSLPIILRDWHTWLTAWIQPVRSLGISGDLSTRDLITLIESWAEIEKRRAALFNHAGLKSVLGDAAIGCNTDWDRVQTTEAWLDNLIQAGIPNAWLEKLLMIESREKWAEVVGIIFKSAGAWHEILQIFEGFQKHLPEAVSWVRRHVTPELAKQVAALTREWALLPTWAQYCRLREQGAGLGVAEFMQSWEHGKIPTEQLADMFTMVEYRRLIAAESQANPVLHNFTVEGHEQARVRFQKLDEQLIRLNREQIAATIGGRGMPRGNGMGPRGTWTDGALVTHQTSLQMRQISIRQLMSRALPAIKAIKPCFMMSPLTVAQFLDPSLPPFDVLVMDEASQILPEDALGAIARAKQLVVVGDPKQLPPTNFFRVSSDEEENEDDESLIEATESILETCETAFGRTRRLKWHYRSLHESLIAFSNAEFYGDLLVFPSPVRDASRYGIRWHKVNGIYKDKQNQIEADAVVDAVVRQLQTDPSKSIGVVTFNLKQKELILDILKRRTESDPLLAQLVEQAYAHLEPLIVRNLESIQGEQRDIIFISVNYGSQTIGGPVAQRFGPVNSKTGWRRLNVMFSRSKERMEVFSSISADSIVAEPDSKTGPAYLARFLRYAETGKIETETPYGERDMDSDFERSVAEYIRRLGYDVEAQVGVAGFFIDIGVFPRGKRTRFMLGIECDGAAYHSSRVARDRDCIREMILRKRGWNIYRIWSQSWFQDRATATIKLRKALKDADCLL